MDEEDEISDPADNDDDIHEEVKAPSSREVEHSLEAMKSYFLFSKKRGRQRMNIVFKFENLVIVEKSENYKQSTIGDFFSKN